MPVGVAQFLAAGKGGVDRFGESKMSKDFVSRHIAIIVFHHSAILASDVASILQHASGAAQRIASVHAHEVEQVGTQNNHVFAASA